jgi:hypothetical protein
MWPTFQEGDLLEYLPCTIKQLQPGDCVVYRSHEGHFVTHRVVSRRTALVTRGDAFKACDAAPVTSEQVLGKVVKKYRHGRGIKTCGGLRGRLVDKMMHYAGRIDPERDTRGGRLARFIQAVSMKMFKPLWSRGKERVFGRQQNRQCVYWMLGRRVLASQCSLTGEWAVPWPAKILIRIKAQN